MNTSTLSLSAAAFGLALLIITPAAAGDYRGHTRYGDYWGNSGYAGSYYDDYRYPGIAWYGTYGYRYTPFDDFGEGYAYIYGLNDDYEDYVGDYYDSDDDDYDDDYDD